MKNQRKFKNDISKRENIKYDKDGDFLVLIIKAKLQFMNV